MMKQKELLILLELRKNSRISSVELSKNTKIPPSTTTDKLKKLRHITRNIPLFNFDEIGYNTRVIMIVKSDKKDELRNFLINNSNINSISRINNKSFIIEAIFKDLKELESFKEKLYKLEIENLKTHHIIEDIKKEDFLTKQEHLDLIS